MINAWADLAANALSGEQRESDIPCWEGHYEQFGMTMLNLLDLSQRRYVPFHDKILPDPEDVDHIFDPGSNSSQRIFYRSWFGLIGHPHFMHHGAFGMELEYQAYTRLCLTIAWDGLTCRV